MTRKEYTDAQVHQLVTRSHASLLAVVRHLHRAGPEGVIIPDEDDVLVDPLPVLVGLINAAMTFLMDDAGMDHEDAIAAMSAWVRVVGEGKAAAAWMSQPPQGTA